jgi:NADPH2:quinone reductase
VTGGAAAGWLLLPGIEIGEAAGHDANRFERPTMSALPATMTCVEIKKPGGPEALVPATRPVPQPKDGEILVKVAAAGVNHRDIYQRTGHHPPPPDASDLPGLEAAGTVAALGKGVTGWKVGEEICALTPGGAYAEYCTVPALQCLPVPKGFDMVHAAALPENYFTVWHNIFERGALKAGESVLIHGGASGRRPWRAGLPSCRCRSTSSPAITCPRTCSS